MTFTRETLRDLALLCGNECAFPGCVAPIYDTVHNEYVGVVAHIKAQSPGGPRHDKSQTKEQRDGLDNLMMLCGSHHRIIDDPGNVEAFSADVLSGYKKDHESRLSRNTILTESMIEEVVRKALLQAREVELELELEKKGLETRFPDDQFKYPPQVRNWIIINTQDLVSGKIGPDEFSKQTGMPVAQARGYLKALQSHARYLKIMNSL